MLRREFLLVGLELDELLAVDRSTSSCAAAAAGSQRNS
jgi:hypothetical protein